MTRATGIGTFLVRTALTAVPALGLLGGCSSEPAVKGSSSPPVLGRRFDETPAAHPAETADTPQASATDGGQSDSGAQPAAAPAALPTSDTRQPTPAAPASPASSPAGTAVPMTQLAAPPVPSEMLGDALKVPFDFLASYEYWPYPIAEADPNAQATKEIPENVRSIHGKRVAVTGFMMPVAVRNGRVDAFLLVRNQLMCCFGMPVGPNEWIDVKMKSGTLARYVPDVPVTVLGTLDIGENATKDGLVLSLYRMVADEVKLPDF